VARSISPYLNSPKITGFIKPRLITMPYKVRVVFTKVGLSKYMSHLDLLRLFGRALRRADLPFEVSEGFSKHAKIVITRALKLGVESESEEVTFRLRQEIGCAEFAQKLQDELPEGIQITKTEYT